ncbi:MAG: ArsR/SmtB family transcription factor [Sciscionella sp.]
MSEPSAVEECAVRVVDRDKVAAVRSVLPDTAAIEDLAQVFALLGEPGRLRLLTALLAAGELCVCDLAAASGLSESAVSHALRLLRAHRVVSVSRRGRMAYYRLDDAHVQKLLDLGITHTQHTTSPAPATRAIPAARVTPATVAPA